MHSYFGFVATPLDAAILIHAAETGVGGAVPIKRRLLNSERALIRSGSVFVFSESSSGMRRWTDGMRWSKSRVEGQFLVYRRIDAPAASSSSSDAVAPPPVSSSQDDAFVSDTRVAVNTVDAPNLDWATNPNHTVDEPAITPGSDQNASVKLEPADNSPHPQAHQNEIDHEDTIKDENVAENNQSLPSSSPFSKRPRSPIPMVISNSMPGMCSKPASELDHKPSDVPVEALNINVSTKDEVDVTCDAAVVASDSMIASPVESCSQPSQDSVSTPVAYSMKRQRTHDGSLHLRRSLSYGPGMPAPPDMSRQMSTESTASTSSFVSFSSFAPFFFDDSLCKRTFSVGVNGVISHVICYYTKADVENNALAVPSQCPEFANLAVPRALIDPTNFRLHPKGSTAAAAVAAMAAAAAGASPTITVQSFSAVTTAATSSSNSPRSTTSTALDRDSAPTLPSPPQSSVSSWSSHTHDCASDTIASIPPPRVPTPGLTYKSFSSSGSSLTSRTYGTETSAPHRSHSSGSLRSAGIASPATTPSPMRRPSSVLHGRRPLNGRMRSSRTITLNYDGNTLVDVLLPADYADFHAYVAQLFSTPTGASLRIVLPGLGEISSPELYAILREGDALDVMLTPPTPEVPTTMPSLVWSVPSPAQPTSPSTTAFVDISSNSNLPHHHSIIINNEAGLQTDLDLEDAATKQAALALASLAAGIPSRYTTISSVSDTPVSSPANHVYWMSTSHSNGSLATASASLM